MSNWYEARTFGNLPTEAAERWGEREALVFRERRMTFTEFAREVDLAAKGLMALGVSPGEKVAVWMTNMPEWLFLMYAIPKIGGVLVPLNTRYRTDDVRYALAQSRSGTLVAMDRSGPVQYREMLLEAMPDLDRDRPGDLRLEGFPDLRRLVLFGQERLTNAFPWEDLLAAGRDVSDGELFTRAAAVDPEGAYLIAYTSGTTGHPKGVLHGHVTIRNTEERARILGVTFRDVHLNYLPLFHIYSFSEIAMVSLLTGSKQILLDIFNPAEALDVAEREGVTMLHGFDTHWTDLLAAQEQRPRRLRLRLGTLPSGMSNSVPIAYRANEVFCPTVSGYGMSEVWAFVAISHPSDTLEQRCEASGFPMNGYHFRVVEPGTGRDPAAGTPGELLVKGYAVMRGYYDKPEATAETVDPEGWVHSGDMASIREDGHLVFMGRYKDMLKVGGENVSPAEIETYLKTIPGVADVSVVGYPDPRLSEVGVAFVIAQTAAMLTEQHVIEACKGRIAGFKIPRHVILVEELPMTSSGKVQKAKLRARALEILGEPRGSS